MLKISRESEINLINVLIDHDIISGKDLPNIKKLSSEGKKSQIDAVFELKLTDENKILDVLVKENESTFWSCKLAIMEKENKIEKINNLKNVPSEENSELDNYLLHQTKYK